MVSTAKDRLITIFSHLMLWGLLVMVLMMFPPLASAGHNLPREFWIKQSAHIALMIVAFYFNAEILVPRLLVRSKTAVFILTLLVISLLSSFLLAQIDIWLNVGERMATIFGRKRFTSPYMDHFGFITMLMILGISTSITMVRRWSSDAKLRSEFESQRTIAELSFLKAQIHPHFFFNTLNSIYALTYVNVETSRQVLHKLSRMMRYLLYETEQNTTLLSKELAFITDYIEIMKLRLNSHTTVNFTMPLKVEEMTIAPMLLLPFVENAFKHGVDDIHPSTISIDIEQVKNGVELEIKNTLINHINRDSAQELEGKGIGMANTRRRLDLLYAGRHSLNIQRDEIKKEYRLRLRLILT